MDFLALFLQCVLLFVGVAFIYGTGVEIGGDFAGKWYKQIMWLVLGFALYFTVALIDYRWLARYAWVFYCGAILLLLMVYLPIGATLNNARSWLKLPGIGFFQPSEMVKPACLLAMAWVATRPILRYAYIPLAVPIILTLLPPFILVCLQPDFGTAMVFLPLTAVMIFLTGVKWRWIAVTFAVIVLMIPLVYGVLRTHQKERLKVFLDSPVRGGFAVIAPMLTQERQEYWQGRIQEFFRPPEGTVRDNWNARQSLLAVGSGGLTGKGYLNGTQHVLGYLPKTVAPTDFIFSVIAEETGFIGAAGLLGIMTCLLLCYCRTALLAGRPMGTCLAMGGAVIMATHIVINVGMTVQAAPIIGIPLPFVSYGGSFMLGTMILAGLVQNVHIHRINPQQVSQSLDNEEEGE